jgi:LacI family transcriptional regulator
MSTKNIRIKDIALMSGVSIGTVDRVLHKRGEVAEATLLRVQKILKETNYSPNVVAQVLKSKKQFHLVSLLPDASENNPFWNKHPVGMTKFIKELNPFPVSLDQYTFDISDEKDFQEKAVMILNDKPDGVIFAPVFKSQSTEFCKILNDRKIPFVYIDGYLEETDFIAYIGEDIFQSGRVAGQLTDMITPKESDILIINISINIKNQHHLNERFRGFMNYLENEGNNKGNKIELNISVPSPENIRKTLSKLFYDHPGISSVFVTGSKAYLIASYLEENNLRCINLIGYDLLELNIKYLKSGTIRFLIGQKPEEQGYKGIKKLYEYISGNIRPEKFEYQPIGIITSENISFYL